MTDHRRTNLKNVMALAWGLYRVELNGPNPRTFADALAGAWRCRKRSAIWRNIPWADQPQPRTLHLRSMLQSPIRRHLGSSAYAATNAARAGYLTSSLGR